MPFSKKAHLDFVPRVLSIAGTDPTGGAGIHADLKSIAAAGGYGMGVVTALVSQNTVGVRAVHTPPVDFLVEQLAAVTEDVTIDAVKIGMLGSRALTRAVTNWVQETEPAVVVLDPVMVATSGDRLLDEDAMGAMRDLVAEATVITPNVPELALLADVPEASDLDELIEQALDFAQKNDVIVIAKTGHLSGDEAGNAVAFPDGQVSFNSSPRIHTENTHGTGCSLSAALATRIGGGSAVDDALHWTTRWLSESIRFADDLHVGQGHGPIDHGHRARRLERVALRRMLPVRLNSNVAQGSFDANEIEQSMEEAKSFFGNSPELAPVGPFTSMLWRDLEDIIAEIGDMFSVHSLLRGDLSSEDTRFFVAQEAWYLQQIFPVLSHLATKASCPKEQVLWSSVAQEALVRALELSNNTLEEASSTLEDIEPTTITQLLLDMHTSCSAFNPYRIAVTSIVAEMWISAELNAQGKSLVDEDSKIADWVGMYSDPAFVDSVKQALEVLEENMSKASEAELKTIRNIFRRAAVLKREAYAQPGRGW
ncbi:bifunctional hydroxymethylpyrimidine kinase/phosphomethylpyrimidine kinase [uncultured Corynebacterium sp.]|uniref:bifunctional hydroxymethylpyrimidine kinase/phosphomethylpyrimidine kinase n=1 Tax=uncultured Corynebacterium sp. TaxID=159447 RepID=UPI00261494F5|nr:bifunctional hydroxymethylpyrimidine kinase/phosphomethylpyrimidine kinase [uncultured Corynebacterium sp.]